MQVWAAIYQNEIHVEVLWQLVKCNLLQVTPYEEFKVLHSGNQFQGVKYQLKSAQKDGQWQEIRGGKLLFKLHPF